ncbi:MAG TPA: reverse transcriptase domain-containing protein, partial [Candidatus Thermoplasmatota archaeon]|nr:reverse transcriptase domain-containing protein [Candidatus Thermoplasmatota archaeon]
TIVRPDVYTTEGHLASRINGVPTGHPVSCVILNLYAQEVDDALAKVPGAFYARYSDDILFAHTDLEVVQAADARMESILQDLRLRFNPTKRKNLFLNGAGRAADGWPGSRGTTVVPYLGSTVWADGTIGLGRKRTRRLLRDVLGRALRTARAARSDDPDEVGRVVCAAVNRAVGPGGGPFQNPAALFLSQVSTSRSQLQQLDYWLTRIVVRAVTGDPSVRALRRIPYQKIRKEWGLVSLVQARNATG